MTIPATSYAKEKINILLLENLNSVAAQKFTAAGYSNVHHLKQALGEDALIEAIKQVHILGIRSKTQVSARVLEAATRLQAIGCFCIGTNQVDLAAATRSGVAVFNAPYSNTRSVAELVIGAAIMLIRRIPDKNKAAHEGRWFKDATGSHELRGKTLGIVGYGNIGSQLSIMAEALGMHVIYFDTETKLPLGNASPCDSLETLLRQSDIVSLHVPDLVTTYHLINRDNLQYCKEGALLINYARGTVVAIDDLATALRDGKLAGAAIDVFPEEPEKNGDPFETPLRGLANVLLTPHIGGSTEEAQLHIGYDVSDKLFQFLEKGISEGSQTIPGLRLPPQANTHRILHIHHNIPGVLSEINAALSGNGVNILGQYLKTNEQVGYVVIDVDRELSGQAALLLKEIKGTIRSRLVY